MPMYSRWEHVSGSDAKLGLVSAYVATGRQRPGTVMVLRDDHPVDDLRVHVALAHISGIDAVRTWSERHARGKQTMHPNRSLAQTASCPHRYEPAPFAAER
jgi:hypothetical protein